MYKEKAVELLARDTINTNISNEDAFLALIHGLSKEKIDNLCNRLKDLLAISFEEAYSITQKMKDNKYASKILKIAIDIISDGDNIGTEIINGHNSSSYISHSIREAILSFEFATMLKLDGKYAFNYGLLHDYGRKYVHSFEHVIKGFEALVDMGYESESKACLIHSFINASRNCLMEVADSSFYLDENNKEKYSDLSKIDDLCLVLDNTNYTDYDRILNIADLMATSSGIVSSKDRIKDILTRRNNLEEAPNWKYFLVSYYNLIVYITNKLNLNNDYIEVDMNISLEKIKEIIFDISDEFYNIYKEKNIVLKI